ncbi:hypothetical protein L7F22_063377 [Adiantum nelumboides]|nr:hypothetical protein [Adiantum nelumboides]
MAASTWDSLLHLPSSSFSSDAKDLSQGCKGSFLGVRLTTDLTELASKEQNLTRRNCEVFAVSSVPTGSRNAASAKRTLLKRRDSLENAYVNSPMEDKSSTAMDVLDLERGVCIPFRKYTPEGVRQKVLETPGAFFSVVSRGAEILLKLGYYWSSLSYDCLIGKGEERVAYRAEQLRNLLCDLGPSFVKAGQVLANRPDIIREDYMNELCILQDDVPAFPNKVAFEIIEEQLGAPLEQLFSKISSGTVAAASLGQVYRATLRSSGKEVAIKKAPGLLQPLPIPDKPWESIAMHFIFDLPRTPTGNDGIWTIICRFSKQAHFVPVRKKIKLDHMVKLFMHNIFKYHGMPQSIVSDRDPRMTSLFWKALFENMGTTLKFSSSFHPQTDGQSEEANSTVLDLLKCYVSEHKATWEHYLPLVEYAYNNTVHTSTGKAPFEIVEGGKKVPPILQTKDKIFEADKYVQNMDEAYRKIKLALEKTQSKQKKAADRHRRELVFSLGDWVLLRFEKARLRKMKGKERLFPKLGMRYYGPFQICDKISDVAYRLKLPEGWKIHNAFHVSLLRPFVGDVPEDMVPEEQPEVEELDEILVLEQILAHKDRKVRGKVARRYLVKFKNYSPMDAKWMEEVELVQRPGIEPIIYRDLFLFRTLASFLNGISLKKLGCNAELIVDEFGEKLLEELDYTLEARNIRDFLENFKDDATVKIPEVYQELSGERVLVMEWIDGIRCTDPQGIKDAGINVPAFITVGVSAALRQLLEFGLFHGDPHPGNIFAMRDGRIAYVDFGNVAELSQQNKQILIDAVVHAVNEDYGEMATDFTRLGFLAPGTDLTPIVPALEAIWQNSTVKGLSDFNFRSVTAKFNQLVYQYPIRIPERFSLVIRSLLTQEGICLTLQPDFKFLEVAYPYVAKRLLTDPDPALRERLIQVLFKDGVFQWKRLENLIVLAREQVEMMSPLQARGKRQDLTKTLASRGAKLDLTDTIKDGARVVLSDAGIRRQLLMAFTEDSRLHIQELLDIYRLIEGEFDFGNLVVDIVQGIPAATRDFMLSWSESVLVDR